MKTPVSKATLIKLKIIYQEALSLWQYIPEFNTLSVLKELTRQVTISKIKTINPALYLLADEMFVQDWQFSLIMNQIWKNID